MLEVRALPPELARGHAPTVLASRRPSLGRTYNDAVTSPDAGAHSVTGAPVPGDRTQERLAALEAKVAALGSMMSGQAAWMTDLQEEVVRGLEQMSGVAERLETHNEWLTSLERWVSSCVKTLANFGAQPLDSAEPGASGTIDVVGSLMARIEVQTVMDWIASVADVPEGPLVSVTTATRNRPGLLGEAIESVLGQSYERFELVIVDDSDGEETQELLAQLHDERVQSGAHSRSTRRRRGVQRRARSGEGRHHRVSRRRQPDAP